MPNQNENLQTHQPQDPNGQPGVEPIQVTSSLEDLTRQVIQAGGTAETAVQPSRSERLINDAPAVGGIVVGAVIGAANVASRMLPEGTPLQSAAEAIANATSISDQVPGATAFAAVAAGFGASRRLWGKYKSKATVDK